MALIRTFYTHDDGNGTSETYALARDVTNDRIFILHTRVCEAGTGMPDLETKLPIGAFLAEAGPAQRDLLELVGTLVPEV